MAVTAAKAKKKDSKKAGKAQKVAKKVTKPAKKQVPKKPVKATKPVDKAKVKAVTEKKASNSNPPKPVSTAKLAMPAAPKAEKNSTPAPAATVTKTEPASAAELEPIHNPFGASDEAVEDTGEVLGVVFPKTVIRIWKAVNGAEINDWKFHPVREPSGGASRNDIILMNGENRPEDLSDDFITIAEQDGNHLVLEKEDDRLLPELLLWDRDSAEVDLYSEELENFAEEAEELRDELLATRRR